MSNKNNDVNVEDCPFCLMPVDGSSINCALCMSCKQKMHMGCLLDWVGRTPTVNRILNDDLLTCKVCTKNSIALCNEPNEDLNVEIKKAIAKNPTMKGGRKGYKSKKGKKGRKSKKSKKITRKRRKGKK